MRFQRGFINLDLRPLFWLAGVGLFFLAVLVFIGIPALIWWAINHV
jgi:hypothetical protein